MDRWRASRVRRRLWVVCSTASQAICGLPPSTSRSSCACGISPFLACRSRGASEPSSWQWWRVSAVMRPSVPWRITIVRFIMRPSVPWRITTVRSISISCWERREANSTVTVSSVRSTNNCPNAHFSRVCSIITMPTTAGVRSVARPVSSCSSPVGTSSRLPRYGSSSCKAAVR